MRYLASNLKYLIFFDNGAQEWRSFDDRTWKLKDK
jgi:hypothetical protein